MSLSLEQVQEQLKKVIDLNLDQDVMTAKYIKNIQVDKNTVSLDLVLGYPDKRQLQSLTQQVIAQIKLLNEKASVVVSAHIKIVSHVVQRGLKPLPNIKNIIAVASGKGGVGKSTTAVNLALALAQEGAQVGILDADIYGPSQPTMLGVSGRPQVTADSLIQPVMAHGVQAMSMGFMVDTDTAMIWRGPMVSSALEQLLNQTNWKDLDYLLIDMPPGTGDIQLTLSQKIPVTGAVIVTTPQDIALLDAKRGLKMFEKVGVPILGVIENMSIHICENCGHTQHIFGEGGGQKISETYEVEYLGGLPLDMKIREQADSGLPTVVADPNGEIAQLYKAIARRMVTKISILSKDMSLKFPAIVIQNT